MTDTNDKPSAKTLIERAAAFVPELRDRAPEVDRTGVVSAEMIRKFHDAGLYRISRLERFGGLEMDFRVQIRVIMELARGCGSTAWVYGNTAVAQIQAAMFSPEAQNDLWGPKQDSVISASFAPTGKATAAEGGYIVNGTWGFASGIDHADWHVISALLQVQDDTPPAMHFLSVPREDFTVIEGSWETVGMRGTASKDVKFQDVFVPKHRVLSAAAMLSGDTPGRHSCDYAMLKLPLLTFAAATFVASALGMVQDGIDAFLERAKVGVTRGAVVGAGNRIAEFAAVQSKVAEAVGLLDAAKLLLMRDLDDTLDRSNAGEKITVDMRLRNRLNQALAARFCVQAIEAIFSCTGGAGLYLNDRTQRIWRDVNSVGKHISLNWDVVSTMYGQHVLGLEPKGQY